MKNVLRAVLICASCLAALGCTTVMGNLPTISAGLTGCPPDKVAIHDEQIGYYNDTWTATCQGKTFYCVRQVKGNTNCTESLVRKE
jgi:O-acetyl-ADP-ribose deacetylase (regulator of RNase III)